MIVSMQHGFVLLAMPKCASNSARAALLPHADLVGRQGRIRHVTYGQYASFVAPLIRAVYRGKPDPEVICLFREPAEWLHSWYRFRGKRSPADANSTAGISFETFYREATGPRPKPFAAVGSQCDFIGDEAGVPGNLRLVRFDDFGKLMDELAERIGAKLEVGRRNKAPAHPSGTGLDEEARRTLRGILTKEYGVYDSIAPL